MIIRARTLGQCRLGGGGGRGGEGRGGGGLWGEYSTCNELGAVQEAEEKGEGGEEEGQ